MRSPGKISRPRMLSVRAGGMHSPGKQKMAKPWDGNAKRDAQPMCQQGAKPREGEGKRDAQPRTGKINGHTFFLSGQGGCTTQNQQRGQANSD